MSDILVARIVIGVGGLAVLAIVAALAWPTVERLRAGPCVVSSSDLTRRHYVDGNAPAQYCDRNAVCWNED
jgi:hypothetical protein